MPTAQQLSSSGVQVTGKGKQKAGTPSIGKGKQKPGIPSIAEALAVFERAGEGGGDNKASGELGPPPGPNRARTGGSA